MNAVSCEDAVIGQPEIDEVTYWIRRVRSRDDLRDCFAVIGGCFSPPIPPDDWRLDRLLTEFDNSQPLMVVAERDGEVVGGALGRLGDGTAGVNILAFQPAVRRVGLGRRVMQTLEVEAMARGARTISLGAVSEAHGFYARLGFSGKRVGMMKGLPLPGRVRDLRVRKLLDAIGDMEQGQLVSADATTGKVPPLW
jgi:ribosomal protein S18 acetylase RimI-like enzyme